MDLGNLNAVIANMGKVNNNSNVTADNSVKTENKSSNGNFKSVMSSKEDSLSKTTEDNKTTVENVSKDINEAINHINKFGSGHSEAIVTKSYEASQTFLQKVNAAAVYVNASTRFTDGEEFGFGAEIGISTQKLHARGPMGLKELTTVKYIIFGNGQIRQ